MLVKDNRKCTWYGKVITEAKYDEILTMLRNMPTAPDGYSYRLTAELEWELYKLPLEEVMDEESTEGDYQDVLAEMGYRYDKSGTECCRGIGKG